MWWKLLLVPVILYVAVLAGLYFMQTSLVFPASGVRRPGPLPPGAERLVVVAADGVRLQGVLVRAREGGGGPLILGFGGNAWNADDTATTLVSLFPDHDVVAFHFRGYAPSGGQPSSAALLADAPRVFDEIVRLYHPPGIVAVGFSVGTGIAARLAAERPLAGAILVTPYDSLAAVGADHYRWLPVRLLFTNEIPAAADLARSRVPVAIFAAGRDRLIYKPRTDALRRSAGDLVYDRTFPAAGHDDIVQQPQFRDAIREALAALRSD